MLKKWKKISSEVIFSNPWWKYCFDRCLMPNGKEGEYHYMSSLGSVVIIPITNEGKIILINQYRYLFQKESIELPMGHRENRSPLEAAKKELEEETGYSADIFEEIGTFEPFNGKSDDVCYVFIANHLFSVTSACDESEEFEQLEVTTHQFDQMIQDGTITDGMVIAAWALAKPHVLKIIEDQTHL